MKTILIIEDDDELTNLLRKILQKNGFRVETVATGPRLADEARRLQPDLVLLDLSLPETDGDAIFRLLRADPATGPVPIIVMSGDPEVEHRARALGADGCLRKPFKVEALLASTSHLAGRAA
jgi:DNA-binding response OmpR family regulator